MSTSDPLSDQPIQSGNGNGDREPPTNKVQITQVSPIAALLVGGIDITINGSGFQPGAEVFFGSLASPEVIFDSSTQVRAKLPNATEPGSVEVAVAHPDGTMATQVGGFTYVVMEPGDHAEVLGVEPANVIEDTETEVTIRGRNLVFAYEKGAVLLRGPSRVNVKVAKVTTKRDELTGVEELTFNLRITATPALEPQERMFIQVLASRRVEAQDDGVFESSRQMFVVVPNSVPVPFAYTANIDPAKPNLVVVAGRNLEGCSFDLGESVTIQMQRSEEGLLAGIVIVPEGAESFKSLQMSILGAHGRELARYDMSVGPTDPEKSGAAPPVEPWMGDGADPKQGAIGLSLTQAPGQELVAPTSQDSAVFDLSGRALSSLNPDWSNYAISTLNLRIGIPIINYVRLIPFFDGGGEDRDTPIQARVGSLFRVRGEGLLLALRVEVSIWIEVVVVIGFVHDNWHYDLANEFPEHGWVIGSIVIGVIIVIHIEVFVHFLIALVLPTGQLQVIELFELTIGLDFTITNNGLHLHFDPHFHHKVNFRGIFPFNNLLPCDGRFQIAEENGHTVFPDAFGGHQSFYFARAAGQCCTPWTFDLDLVRFTDGGPELILQGPFTSNICVTPAPTPGLANIIITSEHPAPSGFPPRLTMTFDERAALKCLAQPVDAGGNPTGAPFQDVTTLGYNVKFFLEPFLPDVLDPTLVGSGDAAPVLAGDNIIHARIWPRQDEPQFFTFSPFGILGFSISGQLSRNLPPAVVGGTLPVTVQNPTQIVVLPTLVFRDPQNPNVPTESPVLFTNQQEQVREIERYEPFEYNNGQSQQLEYVLAVKLSFPSNFTFPTALTFKITEIKMMVLEDRAGTPISEAPLKGTGFLGTRATDNTAGHFFDKLVFQDQEVTVNIQSRPAANAPIELKTSATVGFMIAPNIRDAIGLNKLVPPGKFVTGKDVMLLIKLEESSPATVAPIKQLKLAVRNDETYEEYLRVFPETQGLLTGDFLDFPRSFYDALPFEGPPTADLLAVQGKRLWALAVTNVQASNDDRPLYWARLQAICALRAYYKRNRLGQPTVEQFEWPSRGLEADGSISFGTPLPAARKVVVTSFDPFQLATQPIQSNPAGLIALVLEGVPDDQVQPPAIVKSAIFPVRYRDFDAGMVETAAGTIFLDSIVMLLTCSMNDSDYYDVERFACRARVTTIPDNEHKFPTSIVSGTVEFFQSTLPYERVITSVDQTRRLSGPNATSTPFVTDQSYKGNYILD